MEGLKSILKLKLKSILVSDIEKSDFYVQSDFFLLYYSQSDFESPWG